MSDPPGNRALGGVRVMSRHAWTTFPCTIDGGGSFARRIALLTPYVHSINEMVEAYLVDLGLEIAARGSFKQSVATINRISEGDVARVAIELASRDVDALFISCTGLRSSGVIETIERMTGKPVIASNQALAWDLLRVAGIDQPIAGRGRLLRS